MVLFLATELFHWGNAFFTFCQHTLWWNSRATICTTLRIGKIYCIFATVHILCEYLFEKGKILLRLSSASEQSFLKQYCLDNWVLNKESWWCEFCGFELHLPNDMFTRLEQYWVPTAFQRRILNHFPMLNSRGKMGFAPPKLTEKSQYLVRFNQTPECN